MNLLRSWNWKRRAWAFALVGGALLAAACGSDADGGEGLPTATAPNSTPVASPTAAPAENPFAGVPGIVDAENDGWPREVEGLNGRVSIVAKPERIHTMSVGLDEITIGLVPVSRMVAVGSATKNPDSSSLSHVVQGLPTVAREPEAIASVDPDLVIASPTQKPDIIAAIERLEIPVIQLDLDPTPEGRIATILLLGYIYGEEERAVQLAEEAQKRYDAVVDVTSQFREGDRPVVVSTTKYATINISGAGTTFEGIIVAAGGINGGTKAGIDGNQQSSLEGIVAANPGVIILPMAADVGEAFKAEILSSAAMANTPAVRDNRVYVVPPPLYTTNSFANVRAVEHLAHILWPDEFPAEETPQFTLPTGQ